MLVANVPTLGVSCELQTDYFSIKDKICAKRERGAQIHNCAKHGGRSYCFIFF
jgi:hypothetical protein